MLLLSLGEQESDLPAVLVVANMEGDSPVATQAAVDLCRRLLSDWKEDLKSRRWYVLPVGNPEGPRAHRQAHGAGSRRGISA